MTKSKIFFSFFNLQSIIFILSIFILKANAETKIVAKEGDTLLKLSKRHGIPLKELMYKNNFEDATRLIEGEVIIIPKKNNHNSKTKDLNKYKVIEGDTLYKIARLYNVKTEEIISINNLEEPSFLKTNQIILLPKGAILQKATSRKDLNLGSKKVFFHQTSKVEKLSEISEIHKIPIEEIITLNQLIDQKKVNPNTKLKIRKNNSIKWLPYGSLMLNWSDWRYLDGNYITKAKNNKQRYFYLAINCERRTLNNTLKNSLWTNWYFPKSKFEFKLINDFCDKDYKI